MKAVIFKCRPGSRFHLGLAAMRQNATLTDTAEIIHSDVLFGAFLSAVSQRYPSEVMKWKLFFEQSKIKLSSAFNCLEYRSKIVYLLPKPITLNAINVTDLSANSGVQKRIKKIKYLSKGVWERGLLPHDWMEENGSCFIPDSRVVMLKEEFEGNIHPFKLSEKVDTQKVKVRSTELEGRLYTQTDLTLLGSDDVRVHWYFLCDDTGLQAEEKQIVEEILELVASNGLGGDRSTGCGHIEEVVFDTTFCINQPADTDLYSSLSLLLPSSEDVPNLQAYQVMQRGGMYFGTQATPNRIKMINMLTEGAVTTQPIVGRIADLSVADKVHWRSGMGFSIPLPKAYYCK